MTTVSTKNCTINHRIGGTSRCRVCRADPVKISTRGAERTTSIRDAVSTMDPFRQELVGLRVVHTDGRRGEIIRHECYDTDTCLCVERASVRWDGGDTTRHDMTILYDLRAIYGDR